MSVQGRESGRGGGTSSILHPPRNREERSRKLVDRNGSRGMEGCVNNTVNSLHRRCYNCFTARASDDGLAVAVSSAQKMPSEQELHVKWLKRRSRIVSSSLPMERGARHSSGLSKSLLYLFPTSYHFRARARKRLAIGKWFGGCGNTAFLILPTERVMSYVGRWRVEL